jgi:transglycosylase-like protein with SLT domain
MQVALILIALLVSWPAVAADYFVPSHRVTGIGIARDDLSAEMLKARTELMIQSQTFAIMRDPLAVPGAKTITSPKLQSLFRAAEKRSGVPASLLEAIAYLESWGEAKVGSPTGPKGIMQVSGATARSMGLRVVAAKRYKVTRERVLVTSKQKKPVFKTVTRRTPYTVIVRDDRLNPYRAIPAAANYFASMVEKFGGTDWALFAYHCGQGCVSEMMELTRRAKGIPKDELTVPRMFFAANPARNRELYEAIQQQMQRDYSPTYYFRVMRAQELLALYRRSPQEFQALAQQYRSDFADPSASPGRAPHRLSVWLKRNDLLFRSSDLIRSESGKRLVKAFNRPDYFGYSLNVTPDSARDLEAFQHASPAAIGTLTYIAWETRRLFEEVKPKAETFKPLPVVSLVAPEDYLARLNQREALTHSSGQVFDIDYSSLPPKELECLRFVLNDLGWNGYLGFVEEGRDSLHIGCSPSSRDFFSTVFQEASEKYASLGGQTDPVAAAAR